MKKILAIFSLILCMFLLCSCGVVDGIVRAFTDHETVVTHTYEYNIFWDLPECHSLSCAGRLEGDLSATLFPSSIDSLNVETFYGKHVTFALLGTGWQVFLKVNYTEDEFSEEVERIKSICKGSPVFGNTEYFDVPAYASMWNDFDCFEYALTDEENHTVSYIYIQQFPDREDLSDLPDDVIPKDYGREAINDVYPHYKSEVYP